MAAFPGVPLPSQLRLYLHDETTTLASGTVWGGLSSVVTDANLVPKASNIAGLSSTPNSFTDAVYNQASADTFTLPSTPDGVSFELQTRGNEAGYQRVVDLSAATQVTIAVVAYSAAAAQTAWVFIGTISDPSLNFPSDGIGKTTINIARQGSIYRIDQA